MNSEPVLINLLPFRRLQLYVASLSAFLAEILIWLGWGCVGYPDLAALSHLEKGLEDGNAGCDDDEATFDAI